MLNKRRHEFEREMEFSISTTHIVVQDFGHAAENRQSDEIFLVRISDVFGGSYRYPSNLGDHLVAVQ